MFPVMLVAQEARIKVSTKSQVVVGEQFRVVFEINADGKKFSAPSFEGFSVVGGPFNSTSSSVQIVNGSMSRTVTNREASPWDRPPAPSIMSKSRASLSPSPWWRATPRPTRAGEGLRDNNAPAANKT